MRLLITFLRLPATPPPAVAAGAPNKPVRPADGTASGCCTADETAGSAACDCCTAGRAEAPLALQSTSGRSDGAGAAHPPVSAAAAASEDKLVNKSASSGALHGTRACQQCLSCTFKAAHAPPVVGRQKQTRVLCGRATATPYMLLLVCLASCGAVSAAAGAPAVTAGGDEGKALWACAARGAVAAGVPACIAGAAATAGALAGLATAAAAVAAVAGADGSVGAARLSPLNRSSSSSTPSPERSAGTGAGCAARTASVSGAWGTAAGAAGATAA